MPRVKNMMIYIKTLGGAVKKSTFILYHDFARMSIKMNRIVSQSFAITELPDRKLRKRRVKK